MTLLFSVLHLFFLLLDIVGGSFAEDAEYELAEFMFHWGKEDDRGSEHTVNFKAYPMEVSQLCPSYLVNILILGSSVLWECQDPDKMRSGFVVLEAPC